MEVWIDLVARDVDLVVVEALAETAPAAAADDGGCDMKNVAAVLPSCE